MATSVASKTRLTVLLVGNGGREHALAWKLAQSSRVARILAVPGNGGTASCHKVENIPSSVATAEDFASLVTLAQREGVNLVVPGPEAPLVDGIEAYFRAVGIPCFGPSKEAAILEASKTYSKDFMRRYNIPTATYRNFSDYATACAYIEELVPATRTADEKDPAIVIKATGIAAGKGVILPFTRAEALAALKSIMVDHDFGAEAGAEVVIEEFLDGDELSILTFCDGYTFKSLPMAQDHKRIFDGDLGPNTGGMGCYAPTNLATPELLARIDREVLAPTLEGMRKDWRPFRGLLFTGLMIAPDGSPRTLEYNVRFGDPETQTVLPLLSADTDLAEIMLACTSGCLDAVDIKIENKFSATVVIASGGYPGSYAKGTPMTVQEPASGSGITVFHAGTKLDLATGVLQTSGGRVIAPNATADTLEAAVAKAYAEGIPLVQFSSMHYRKDIAHRAFRKTKPAAAAGVASLSYAEAGVSIEAGNALVDRIKKAVASTAIPGADAEIGGFGGEVDLSKADLPATSGKLPILVGAIDGVGTKLKIALALNKHDTVGIDLVAMNVNDLVVQGARPLMFLDYIGCSKLIGDVAAAFVEGVAAGCRESGCALVGGETAEMPGMYQGEEYDAAGAAIGVMQADERLPRMSAMAPGDVLLGLASSGLHSNGFSLVRRIVERAGVSYTDKAPWTADSSTTVGESLLTPTRIYVRSVLSIVPLVKGLAHITGGGLTENVPRMLPPHLSANIDVKAWPVPPVFTWLRQQGNVAPAEMGRTFNNGIGMVIAVGAAEVPQVTSILKAAGETVFQIGQLVERRNEGCVLQNLYVWA
ncbi:Bifunctional purine biosynthetic protein ADE1 [Sporothrix epigloea]|uniref:Bifunctional purine biosynthetic protein ADE1 n=1 Tax=Sporothrix epigloea TaxID=1892477 RepID=A0ABP0DW88_9PEZI